MKRIIDFAGLVLAALVAVTAAPPAWAQADPAVTGAVSYDPLTKLYTYTYTVDSRVLSSQGYVEFAIRENVQANWSGPMPSQWSQPDGFGFVILAGGSPPPLSISGSYWGWVSSAPNVTYEGSLVFSLTTTRGVSTDPANNFYLFTGGGTSGPPGFEGFVDFGHIVGPSLVDIAAPTFVPEPGMAMLWAIGLMPVVWGVRRRRAG